MKIFGKAYNDLSDAELKTILETDKYDAELRTCADRVRREIYGDAVYV
ncbi:MAG: [FeFe] hydrogenase H-cluster radical SAM maturase HydE, partial [Eggerthellaceae bacterium]|nr:[FeFe] hydrogenase H-cluster radical SAM maturase HydE [Eggerthellaceae bacterium]